MNEKSMKRVKLLLFFCLVYLNGFTQNSNNFTQYVDPFIGTEKMGHTYPGATVPFGAVQLSPDTDTLPYSVNGHYNPEVYRYCAGYQYNDPTIVGFSHTHFSGTGHSDLGDILLMPATGALKLNPGTAQKPESGFRSRFSHDKEAAEPNYYTVLLEDYDIRAELTTTTRTGMHRYTFPESEEAHIILDLMHGIYNYPEKNQRTVVKILNDSLLTGYRETRGWARTRTLYFAIAFSKPFENYGAKDFSDPLPYKGFWGKWNQSDSFPDLSARQLRMHFDFTTQPSEEIIVKVAISAVSQQDALNNMKEENPGWNFDEIRLKGQTFWNNELAKIKADMMSREDMVNFYTAMYHAFLSPTVFMDVNNRFRGLDQNNYTADGFTNYTTFSLWDTYRALHPLFNIVQPKRNRDMIYSMLVHYNQSTLSMLPIWSTWANETWCMSGYHSVSVISDAVAKGVFDGNIHEVLDACVATATHKRYEGIGQYMHRGYIPYEMNGTSVSNTLEYAYDDWCIAQLALIGGRKTVYDTFISRSRNWKNVYDTVSGFMRPKSSKGQFKQDFDPLKTHGQGFIEGNAWNYSLFVPQDPQELIKLMGGEKRFISYLDSLFTMHLPDEFFADTEDITREGIIGNYVHGNEPSHHVPYLYNWTSKPWKTQERVRMILKKQYHNGPDGLGGNDDCGQMSAWYIFGALGFYPVAPGSQEYAIGSPLVKSASIPLENGKTFNIEAVNQSDRNVYVKRVELNGKTLDRPFLKHSDILSGGKLVFYMSRKK